MINRLSSQIVIDHMGHIPSDIGINSRGFKDILKLRKEGENWVRLAGFCSLPIFDSLPFSDIEPYVKALVDTRPDRLLWGSDWADPAVDFEPPNAADLFQKFSNWVDDDTILKLICVDNPSELYWDNS